MTQFWNLEWGYGKILCDLFNSKRIRIFVLSARISLFAICINKHILADKLTFYVGISTFAQISLSLQIALFILLFAIDKLSVRLINKNLSVTLLFRAVPQPQCYISWEATHCFLHFIVGEQKKLVHCNYVHPYRLTQSDTKAHRRYL
jgi:hypothetical protein